jgi:hypothetical protein
MNLLSHRTLFKLTCACLLATTLHVTASFTASAAPAASTPLPKTMTEGFKLIENGTARAIIVTPDTPSGVVKYAATELQQHIERATGTALEIASEKNAAGSTHPNRIYLGPVNAAKAAGINTDGLPLNGFRTKTTANALFLLGSDNAGLPTDPGTASRARSWKNFEIGTPPLDDTASAGTLFAVYDWLENQLGARWLWPGDLGTVIAKTKTVGAGATGTRQQLPALIHSQPRLSAWPGMDPTKRDQYIYDTSAWLRRQRFVRSVSFHYGHGYTKYWERFGATNPEFFAQREDGKREPFNSQRPSLVQLCVSNPGLHRQIIADWLVQRRDKPALPWINGVENDKTANDPACTCDVCRSWDPKNPVATDGNPWLAGAETAKDASAPKLSLSDRYARFYLALQEEGKKHDHDATVIGYAYADYTQPPVETKLNKNIIIGIVPAYSFPLEEKDREKFRKLWDGWAKTGARLYLRPNYTLPGYAMPYNYAAQFGTEFKYGVENGMIGTDFDSLTGMWGVQSIDYYMMGRLNTKPEMSVQEVLNEYYNAFGPAAPQIKQYFEHWEAVTARADSDFKKRTAGGWAFISKGGDEVYTPDSFQTGNAILANAKTAAANDPETLARVDYLQQWLTHAELCMKALSAYHAHKAAPRDAELKATFENAKATVDAFREANSDLIVNVGLLRRLEVWSGWRKSSELTE